MIKRVVLGSVGVLLCLVSGRGQTTPPWREHFQEAYTELQGGNFETATRRFEALWRSDPKDFELAYAIGTALDSTGYHREATGWYLESLKINHQFSSAYNNLALNYASQGEFEKALSPLRRVTQLDPRNERAFYNLGLVQLQLRRFHEAARAFTRAHELKPAERDPLLRLAYASLLAGKRRTGLLALESLLKLTGDAREAALLAVQVLNAAGLYREALERARKAHELGASPPLSYQEANSLFHLGEYKQAVEALSKVIPPSGAALDYYLLLGSAQALAGDLPRAVTTLQTTVRLAPQQPEPYYRLALVFLEGYRDQDAQEVLSAGLRQIPQSPRLLYGMGILNEIAGRNQQAIEYLEKSLQAKHSQPEVWSILGEIYAKASQYDRAAGAYQNALNQGASAGTVVKYADLLIHFRKFAEAEALLTQQLRTQRNLAPASVVLGKLYNAQKQYARAEKVLRRAVELDPDNPDAHWFLTGALQHLGRAEEARREGELATEKKAALRERERASLLRAVLVPRTGEPASETGLKMPSAP